MKRPLFNLAAAVSLVMMLAMVVLWVRSYSRTFLLHESSRTVIALEEGRLELLLNRYHVQRRWFSFKALGVRVESFNGYTEGVPFWGLVMSLPLWLPVAVAAVVPGYCVFRRLVWRPQITNPTICQSCGYDLRATPQRCPECGTAAPAAAGKARRARRPRSADVVSEDA